MKSRTTPFRRVNLALQDLLGPDYIEAVCAARRQLSGQDLRSLKTAATGKVDFFPTSFQRRLAALLPQVGAAVTSGLAASARGATTAQFAANSKINQAPISALGYYRIGEDGRLYLIAKSEHYHAPLGHSFPGYALIDRARALGIPNATHNNTRGHITRRLEEELIRTVNGIAPNDAQTLGKTLSTSRAGIVNRVLNLETGSLAVEAAIKMALGRFYKVEAHLPAPKYQGRVPVLAVIGDEEGGIQANYHGTTVIAQVLRGMWPELRSAWERSGTLVVRSVRANNFGELEALFGKYESGPYKLAAFFHELVLMNYAGKRLSERFVRRMYELCKQHDVPTLVDEIQTCLWSPQLFLHREYKVKPTFVAIGKGFPGGEYPASRLLFSSDMDFLPQFGALVTNGQEELAALSYLVTMSWAEANADVTSAVGEYYEGRLRELASRHGCIQTVEGQRHLAGIYFHDLAPAKAFSQNLNKAGLDVSVQTYKAGCPPSALTKLPLVCGYDVMDFVIEQMDRALAQV